MWVDGQTLAYLNGLRSNILVNSTMFDQIQLNDRINKAEAFKPQRVQPTRDSRRPVDVKPEKIVEEGQVG